MAPRALIRPLVLLALVGLLGACQDQQARQQSAQLAASLAQLQDRISLLESRLQTLQGQNTDLIKQVQQLQTQVAQLSLRQNSAAGQNGNQSAGNQTSGTVGSSASGSSGANTGTSAPTGSDAEQARLYSASVHAAYLARMAEDPMYTPDSLTTEVSDCLKASAVGDRSFGARPAELGSCAVTPDGENDVRVTVKAGGQTFVNGARQAR